MLSAYHISLIFIFGRSVTSNGSLYATGPSSCLSVTLVNCGQIIGWIKMPLGRDVGLSLGDCVRWVYPAPSMHWKGNSSQPPFWPTSVVTKRSPSQQLLSYCWAYSFLYIFYLKFGAREMFASTWHTKSLPMEWSQRTCCQFSIHVSEMTYLMLSEWVSRV